MCRSMPWSGRPRTEARAFEAHVRSSGTFVKVLRLKGQDSILSGRLGLVRDGLNFPPELFETVPDLGSVYYRLKE